MPSMSKALASARHPIQNVPNRRSSGIYKPDVVTCSGERDPGSQPGAAGDHGAPISQRELVCDDEGFACQRPIGAVLVDPLAAAKEEIVDRRPDPPSIEMAAAGGSSRPGASGQVAPRACRRPTRRESRQSDL